MPHKIPITAITGFLGSGKTTLVNYILDHNQGLKIGVVVNDYGAINIDAELISSRTDAMMELTNGCACCSLDSLELDEAINQFVAPGNPMDYIIIEASGLAEPADLAANLRGAAGKYARLDSIVAVLDAVNLDVTADHDNATQQVAYGDFVIINKVDLASVEKVNAIKEFVTTVNERARMLTATRGEVDVRLLLDQDIHNAEKAIPRHNHDSEHLHNEYQTVSVVSDKPLDPAAFQKFVNDHIPATIYRAKGIVDLGKKGRGRKYTFQLVGKRAEMTWTEWQGQPPKTELVFIGKGFDANKVLGQAAACVDNQPNKFDPAKQVALPQQKL